MPSAGNHGQDGEYHPKNYNDNDTSTTLTEGPAGTGSLASDHDVPSSSLSSSRASQSVSSVSSKSQSASEDDDDDDDHTSTDDDDDDDDDDSGSSVSSLDEDDIDSIDSSDENDGGIEQPADELDGLTSNLLRPSYLFSSPKNQRNDDRGAVGRNTFGTLASNLLRNRRGMRPQRLSEYDQNDNELAMDAVDDPSNNVAQEENMDGNKTSSPSKDARGRRQPTHSHEPEMGRKHHHHHHGQTHIPSKRSSQSKRRSKRRLWRVCPKMHWSSSLLVASTLLWVSVQLLCFSSTAIFISTSSMTFWDQLPLDSTITSTNRNMLRSRLRRHKQISGLSPDEEDHSFRRGPIGQDGNLTMFGAPTTKEDKEKLPPECDYADWQKERGSSLLTCNILHELDLRWFLGMSHRGGGWGQYKERKGRRRRIFPGDNQSFVETGSRWGYPPPTTNETETASLSWMAFTGSEPTPTATNTTDRVAPSRYLSSGLWRDVWSIRPHLYSDHHNDDETDWDRLQKEIVVLKMMKSEHDVVQRNLDRHRREAIAMDRLTHSPYIIDLFAYCGNSIITEFAPSDLETALQRHSRGGNGGITNLGATPVQQLDLSIQAAKAIQALHENDIIHADLTSQQFLVLPTNGTTPLLKLNDFNRCRFVPRKVNAVGGDGIDGRKDRCEIQIPSAPGLYRSPEEYALQPLTPQMDIFSLGHVMYEIWTGIKPWQGMMGKQLREYVQSGQLLQHITVATAGSALGKLIPQCYLLDPLQRPTASRLVNELEAATNDLT